MIKIKLSVIKTIEEGLKKRFSDKFLIVYVQGNDNRPYFIMQKKDDKNILIKLKVIKILNVWKLNYRNGIKKHNLSRFKPL